MAPEPLVLHGLARSVYTRIARLALAEKGLPFTLNEVEIFGPEGVPAAHFERHPFGRIPVLQQGDFLLYETAAITRHVDEAFDGPALQPADARARARMQQLIGLVDSYAYRPMVWGVFVQQVALPRAGKASDPALIERSLAECARCLAALQALVELRSGSAFLCGATLSLADLHLLPVLRCFALAPAGRAMLAGHPGLSAWMARMSARDSVQHTRSPIEAVLAAEPGG